MRVAALRAEDALGAAADLFGGAVVDAQGGGAAADLEAGAVEVAAGLQQLQVYVSKPVIYSP